MASKFRSGYDVADNKFKDQQSNSRRAFVPRFFLKKGTTGELIFLDDKPVTIEEHVIVSNRNGKPQYTNVTSPSTVGEPDPLKDAGSRTSMVVYYSVVDTKEVYTDKNGKEHKFQKKLLGLKKQAYDALKRRRATLVAKAKKANDEKRMKYPLRYARFAITRGTGQMEPNTGTDWEFVDYVPTKQLLKLIAKGTKEGEEPSLAALNYDELLAPPSEDELEQMARRFERQQASASGGGDDADFNFGANKAKSKSKKAKPADDDDEDDAEEDADEDEDDLDELEAGADDDADDEDDETDDAEEDADEEEDEPAPVKKKSKAKTKAAKPAKAVKAKKSKKVVDDEDELFDEDDDVDEDEEDDAE
jgi:hypothetical protein